MIRVLQLTSGIRPFIVTEDVGESASAGEGVDSRLPGKTSKRETGNRTKTDTGRRDEYSKALERTLVKELCNMAP